MHIEANVMYVYCHVHRFTYRQCGSKRAHGRRRWVGTQSDKEKAEKTNRDGEHYTFLGSRKRSHSDKYTVLNDTGLAVMMVGIGHCVWIYHKYQHSIVVM